MIAITKRPECFAETDVDDEIVLMRLDNGDFFSLAGSAAVIWRLIDGTRDRRELISAMTAEFDGNAADIASDVDEFIEQLRGMGLLTVD